MAVAPATYLSTHVIETDLSDPVQTSVIFFNFASGLVYAQADNAILQGVPTLLRNARRNGKAVTLLGAVAVYQLGEKAADRGKWMGMKTLAISGNDITFEITDGATVGVADLSTELANGVIPDQASPFGILVNFTETTIF